MPRTFDGVDDEIRLAIAGAQSETFGPFTWAAAVKRTGTGAVHAPLSVHTSSGQTRAYFYCRSDNVLEMDWDSVGFTSGTSTTAFAAADGPGIIGLSKSTGGSATVRFHRTILSTLSHAHENAGTVGAANTPGAGGYWAIGGHSPELWNGDIAGFAWWNRGLTDDEWNSLSTSWAAWESLAPSMFVILDQSSTSMLVNDFVGGANQSSITGTAVATGSYPLGYGSPLIDDITALPATAPPETSPWHLLTMTPPGRLWPGSPRSPWLGTEDTAAASEDHPTSSIGALGVEGRAVAALTPTVVAYSPLGVEGRTVAAKSPSVAAVVPLGLDGRTTDTRDALAAALGYLGLDGRAVAALTPSVVAYSALGIEGRALVGASLDISTTGIGFLALEGRAPASAAPSTAVRGYLGIEGRTVAALTPSVLARVDLGLTPYATASRNATALAYSAFGLDGRSLVGAQVDISTTGVAYLGLDARTLTSRQATASALAALGLDARALTTRQALIVVRTDLGLDGRAGTLTRTALTTGRLYFGITGVGGGAPPITIIGPFTLTVLDPTRGLLVLDDVRTLAVIDGERTLEVVIR